MYYWGDYRMFRKESSTYYCDFGHEWHDNQWVVENGFVRHTHFTHPQQTNIDTKNYLYFPTSPPPKNLIKNKFQTK